MVPYMACGGLFGSNSVVLPVPAGLLEPLFVDGHDQGVREVHSYSLEYESCLPVRWSAFGYTRFCGTGGFTKVFWCLSAWFDKNQGSIGSPEKRFIMAFTSF
jgi:hypothetical protein